MTEVKRERVTVWIKKAYHKKLKMRAANKGSTLEDELDQVLETVLQFDMED